MNVYEAKTQLSRLLERVAGGEEVVIARAGRPVARLVPIRRPRPRPPGGWRGRWWLAHDWDSDETNAQVTLEFEEGEPLPRAESAS